MNCHSIHVPLPYCLPPDPKTHSLTKNRAPYYHPGNVLSGNYPQQAVSPAYPLCPNPIPLVTECICMSLTLSAVVTEALTQCIGVDLMLPEQAAAELTPGNQRPGAVHR